MGHIGATDFEKRHDIIKSQQDLIHKGLFGGLPEEDIFKAQKGEGSKGGKVIGHTKSGKAIYENHNHSSHKDFTAADHEDAYHKHNQIAPPRYGKAENDHEKHHWEQADKHYRSAETKGEMEADEREEKLKKEKETYTSKFKEGDSVIVNKQTAKVGFKDNGQYYVKFKDGSDGMFDEKDITVQKELENGKVGKDTMKNSTATNKEEEAVNKLKDNTRKHFEGGDKKSDLLKDFKSIIKDSKDFEEAFKKVKAIKGVPAETANHFSEKYNPDDNLSMEQAFKKFYDEVKGGDIKKSEDNDIEKAVKGEGSRGGKIIGHTKSGKPIYDAATHHAHTQFTKEDHLDAKQAHIDKIDEHHNAYWTARTDAKRKEHEEKTNYHRYQGMSHHNHAANYEKNIIGKTKSGKHVFGNRKPGDNDGFTVDDHRDAAKLHEKAGNQYDAHIHESMARFKEGEEKNLKLQADLKVKVGTGVFDGKEFWRVTSSNGEIGAYPKSKYSEEEAKKNYTEKFSKKDDVKKSDNSDISKAFEILGITG